ncbi:PhoH family protein [Schaalia sp. ZJ405]|uniref:PhoH family protein n=1 Tax=unclassified Schaalia TaxID=2691889 RepID=UPI0013EBDB36|nr:MULTISPECIES: PhoH family protein [unclassified Schaalia]QPK80712.1 PhoH family protein [Schaalia sp. ZJ405]
MSDPTIPTIVSIPADIDPIMVLGPQDQILRAIDKGFPRVDVHAIGRDIHLRGDHADVDVTAQLVRELVSLAKNGKALDAPAVEHAITLLTSTHDGLAPSEEILSVRGRSIRPKTPGQKAYAEAIDRSTIVFGIGPAGTGKTYLAMALAVQRLLSGQVRRIVLTRPAVEAGESLGFLPGTLTDKIDPYLRPLYDALRDMLDAEALPKLMAAGTIEVAPLAYMRGRTLNDSFIVLDEAQNTTTNQMKMFLTRLGFNSQIVVTGDISQVDLPGAQQSGLAVVHDILDDVDGVEFCYLTSADVVRHQIVGDIIDAYSRWDARNAQRRATRTLRSRSPRPRDVRSSRVHVSRSQEGS